MHNESLHLWLESAGRNELLSKPETLELARVVQAGERKEVSAEAQLKAIDKMMASNLRLVVKVWRNRFSYIRSGDSRVVDLLQEGAIGLRRAVLKFDPTRGIAFSTYACHWIQEAMHEFLKSRDRAIRISADCYAVVNTAKKFISEEFARTGKTPSIEQIAKKVKKPVKSTKFFLDRYMATSKVSLNSPTGGRVGEEAGEIQDLITSPQGYDMALDRQAEKLSNAIQVLFEYSDLSDHEQYVVRMRYLSNDTPPSLKEIGEELNLGNTSMNWMLTRAMKKMQSAVEENNIALEELLEAA